MQGRFTLWNYSTKNFKEEDIEQAKKEKCVGQLLDLWDLKEVVRGPNQVLHQCAMCHFYNGGNIFLGAPNPSNYIEARDGTFAGLFLSTDSNIPSYTTGWGGYYDLLNTGSPIYSVGSSGAYKRFVEDQVEPFTLACHAYKEEVTFTSRHLWAPGEGTSSLIRTIKIVTNNDDLDNWNPTAERALIASYRIRDGGGTPITIIKLATDALLVQYDFTWSSH